MKTPKTRRNIYTSEEYDSNNGMLTAIWGPGTWHLLHTMSFNYPVNPTCADKSNYMKYIYSLKTVLPCGKCRKNLDKNFKILPLTMKDMKSRNTFSHYIYNLHELVNKMLHKKSGLTYEVVRERYEHFRARCSKTRKIKENGCTESLYGEKSKCIIKIVPENTKCETLQIDKKCIKHKL